SAFAYECPHYANTVFNATARQAIVDKHNELRATLINGTTPMLDGQHAKSGKNIYKILYDCDLEKQSQQWADLCVYEHSPQNYRNGGENIWELFTTGQLGHPVPYALSAIVSWWNEVMEIDNRTADPSQNGYIFNGYIYEKASHWSQINKETIQYASDIGIRNTFDIVGETD
ncbi:unnamed protein product, partial [Toxocara canis]|uniref:SCP domain-containing protein n=1 Tax=Toxocara canis TaxID=6265 RepID=A0A183VCJ5_TOXCA